MLLLAPSRLGGYDEGQGATNPEMQSDAHSSGRGQPSFRADFGGHCTSGSGRLLIHNKGVSRVAGDITLTPLAGYADSSGVQYSQLRLDRRRTSKVHRLNTEGHSQ